MLEYIATTKRTEALICETLEKEPYFYHTVREALEQKMIIYNPSSKSRSSRIIYRIIDTICAQLQVDIRRSFNLNKRDI